MKLTEANIRKLVREELAKIYRGPTIKNFVGVPASVIIVERPRGASDELEDIIYRINWEALEFQFKGGLKTSNIYGIYAPNKEREALDAARKLIEKNR